jgi:DNA adenine methylase
MKTDQPSRQGFHYSPLRYPGGKTCLYPLFHAIARENKIQNATYVEPFAGGAGAALALLFNCVVERIVINDLDRAIYAFWKSAIFESDRFIESLKRVPVSVEEWKRQRAIYSNKRSRIYDLGFATFFLNRTNVSGILNGGPIGGMSQRGQWKIDARFYTETLIERLQRLSRHKDQIVITNKDAFSTIEAHLTEKRSFIYLDPPYVDKGASLYLNHFGPADHIRLAKTLNKNSRAKWVLTYDSVSQIEALYPNRKCLRYSLNYHARDFRRGKELLILSDALSISEHTYESRIDIRSFDSSSKRAV